MLREVQAVADRLVIIGGGRVVAAGATGDLVAASGGDLEQLFLSLTAGATGVAA
jgi:ABC-2 type transport system ATP-binding protein